LCFSTFTDHEHFTITSSERRTNAILLEGTPIAKLPTDTIFAYATHFDAKPLSLDWIDTTTCVLVYDSESSAKGAYGLLIESSAEKPDSITGLVTAKPLPPPLWPSEQGSSTSSSEREGLEAVIRMRWAPPSPSLALAIRTDQVAADESAFYGPTIELHVSQPGPSRDDTDIARKLRGRSTQQAERHSDEWTARPNL
jgi:hypothetical protein